MVHAPPAARAVPLTATPSQALPIYIRFCALYHFISGHRHGAVQGGGGPGEAQAKGTLQRWHEGREVEARATRPSTHHPRWQGRALHHRQPAAGVGALNHLQHCALHGQVPAQHFNARQAGPLQWAIWRCCRSGHRRLGVARRAAALAAASAVRQLLWASKLEQHRGGVAAIRARPKGGGDGEEVAEGGGHLREGQGGRALRFPSFSLQQPAAGQMRRSTSKQARASPQLPAPTSSSSPAS